MKKLTKSVLTEMLKQYMWLSYNDGLLFAEKRIYIISREFTIVLWFGRDYGWNFIINGSSNYLIAKYTLKLCDELEKGYNYYDNSK